jgi:RNA polymerase sigma-70 factor (ECF subfamily)
MTADLTELEFVALYRESYGRVLAYLRRRVDEETARDIAAATFLTAWRRRSEAVAGGLPWLYVAARLTLANALRAEERKSRLNARLMDAARVEIESTANSNHRATVAEALVKLSDADRELVLLTAWEGLSVSEAAAVLGISAAAASKRLQRARRRLAHRLTRAESTDLSVRSDPDDD